MSFRAVCGRIIALAGLSIAIAVLTASATVPTNLAPRPISVSVPTNPESAHPPAPLTREDAEAFLDGFFPQALARADIAGAVVVVVKDGRVLVEKGYGYSDLESRKPVDPVTTMFRPGSISKLFTWTSVMQLVERGKLDLNRDVNDYLDFRIPESFGKPVTLRNLVTHTAGFEEHLKGLMVPYPSKPVPLRTMAIRPPRTIYPPGAIPAYSNYGASLAGYIVARTSGEPFPDYVARHIFAPLGMTHSSFVQPLPPSLAPDMSKGYATADGKELPFDIISLSPAGALSASGDDMARFMIAHLHNGAYGGVQILKPETARFMHAGANQPSPPLPPMALGFYHEDRNGHTIIGHDGDVDAFHSSLHLILDADAGVFLSVNSDGKNESLTSNTRTLFFDAFMNRYFPPPPLAVAKPIATAAADGASVSGYYEISRRSETTFARLANLALSVRVVQNKDGSLSVPFINNEHWVEIAPLLWREAHDRHRLVAVMENGRVKWLSSDYFPAIFVLQPVPFLLSAGFQLPLMAATFAVLMLTLLLWPAKAMLRWRYASPFPLRDWSARFYRWTRIVVLIDVLAFAGWAIFLAAASASLQYFDARYDSLVRVLQGLSLLGAAGSIVPLIAFFAGLRELERPWWTKMTDGFVALAALAVVWFVIYDRLVTVSLNY